MPVKIKTLRVRLTLWYLAILGLTLCAFAVLLYGVLSRSLYQHHDQELAADASRLQVLLGEIRASTVKAALEDVPDPPLLLLVRDASGAMVYRSATLAEQEPNIGRHEALVHAAAVGSREPQFFTARLERLGSVRFICVPMGQDTYVQIGRELGDVDRALAQIAQTTILLVPIVLVLASFGGVLIARRALAPITAIVRTADAIQATDLSRRVEVQPRDEELGSLVATLNQLFDRLEKAFTSLREFIANASHQLQTPLTVLKGRIELARGTTPGSVSEPLLDDLAEEVDGMAAIVADLRTLSLADVPVPATRREDVDFSKVCREVAEIAGALAEPHNVNVRVRIADDVWVAGDALRLKQMVLNLAENAVKYTPSGGRVEIALGTDNSDAVLRVFDTGPGIPAHDVPHIFERFYRGTAGGRAPASGTGLGLAIVKRLVEVHGGSINVQSVERHGSTFTVRLRRAVRANGSSSYAQAAGEAS